MTSNTSPVDLLTHFFTRFFTRKPALKESVTFDDERIVSMRASGQQETVRWDALQEVSIITSDEGPFVDDLHWVLLGVPGGCAVAGSAAGASELLARLQSLPGFNNEAVIQAMGSTSNARFVCWTRASAA